MLQISSDRQIDDLARGGALLGTGGGGDPYIAGLALKNAVKDSPPRIVPLHEVADDAFVISPAAGGSPMVVLEHLISTSTVRRMFLRAEALHGRRIDYLISAEIGGGNALLPLLVGAIMDRPVIDADGVGRAVPKLQMTTWAIAGQRSGPSVSGDDLGNVISYDLIDASTAEAVARPVMNVLGGATTGFIFPMSGAQAKANSIPGTLSQALAIGRVIREARTGSREPTEALVSYLDGHSPGRYAREIFQGKVIDVVHDTAGGWHFGRVTLSSFDDAQGSLEIDIQNEFLAARLNGEIIVTVPDLILVVDYESGEPLTAEALTYGQRARVIHYTAHEKLTTSRALEAVGPLAFGYDVDFRSAHSALLRERDQGLNLEAAC